MVDVVLCVGDVDGIWRDLLQTDRTRQGGAGVLVGTLSDRCAGPCAMRGVHTLILDNKHFQLRAEGVRLASSPCSAPIASIPGFAEGLLDDLVIRFLVDYEARNFAVDRLLQ